MSRPKTRSSLALLVSALGLCVFVAAASAQGDPDVDKAKSHFIAAESAMQNGDYQGAVTSYQAAYDITGDPALLYKLATAHEKAGACDQAVLLYQRYLSEGAPDPEVAAATQERIIACQENGGALAEGATPDSAASADGSAGAGSDAARSDAQGEPDAETESADLSEPLPGTGEAPPSFATTGPTWKGKAAWSSLAVALGFGTVGAILALSATSQEQDLENLLAFRDSNGQPAEYTGAVRTRYEDFVDKGKTHATWSRIALGAAGVSVAAATALFLWDRADRKAAESRAARIVPVVSPSGVGLAAGWRF